MEKELLNKTPESAWRIPVAQEFSNPPKTIGSAGTTISGLPRVVLPVCTDPPKTIAGEAGTTSCGALPKGRGRGAPSGNLNALKTGRYTAKAKALRKQTWEFTSRIDSVLRLAQTLYGVEITGRRPRKKRWPVMPEELRWKYREKARR